MKKFIIAFAIILAVVIMANLSPFQSAVTIFISLYLICALAMRYFDKEDRK